MSTLDEWINLAWNGLKADAPNLAIRNEADLKCHLFSRLLALKTEVASKHEVHSEIRFQLNQSRRGIIVDIAIADDTTVMAVIELKYSHLPKFEKDLVNLCMLRDGAKNHEIASEVRWVSTPYSRKALKLSESTLFCFGAACENDAGSSDREYMFRKMKEKHDLDCSDIITLPAIIFNKVE